jgi:chromosomal replication initiator protein
LRSLTIVKFDARNLYLEAKDSFQAIWFEEHVHAKARLFLSKGGSKQIKIHLSVVNAPVKEQVGKGTAKGRARALAAPPVFQMAFDSLNPCCTLENFIPTEKSQLAYKLIQELVGAASNTLPLAIPRLNHSGYNPIYLHGGSGTGKTHLLMSLCHHFRQKGLTALYARSETFTDHVVGAIRSGQMSTFRQTYRNIDVLLLDDIHVFSRKSATQEELFHTFNTLHMGGKQIILTSNCAPNELKLIEPRLVSRFEWGIVLPMEGYSRNELILILNQKAKVLNFPLPLKVTEFLIDTFASSPQAIIKALEALILRLHVEIRHPTAQLTTALVKQVLADLMVDEEKQALTPIKIIHAVAEHYGIRAEDILGKAQSRDCALPRQMAMALCRTQLKLPFMKIGEIFSRDHSTVMSSVKQIQKQLTANQKEMTDTWNGIIRKVKG